MAISQPGLGDAERALVERVRKLLDKAEGTTNPHEAEAFSAKAAALVARHRISPERLADARPDVELAIREVDLGRGAYVRARLALLLAVADAHDARVVFQRRPEGTVAMVAGHSDDLAVVGLLYHSLHQQAAAQMAATRGATGAATQRHRRSFLFGYAHRIAEILAESQRAAEGETDRGNDAAVASATVTAKSRAVAQRERAAAVDEFAERSWGRVRAARRPRGAEPRSYTAGFAAASGADVGRSRLAGRTALGRGRP